MHPRCSLTLAALALLVAVPPSAIAQDGDAVIVTATRQRQRANELLSDVSVITREEIEQARPLETLGELLAQEGGVEFSTRGGPGSSSSIYIRGANAGHTLLLIDGMRVGSATLGQPDISAIPLSQIERVEILKGPASSLYGSDAIGGVIQVFTRRGEGDAKINAEVSIGSYQTTEASAGVSGKSDRIRYSLRVGTIDSGGYNSISNRDNGQYNGDKDGYENLNASAQVSIDLAQGHEAGLQVFHSRSTNHYDAAYYDASFNRKSDYDFQSTSTVESYSIFSRNRLTSNWTSLLRIGRSTDDSKDKDTPTTRSDFRTYQDQAVWQNDVKLPVGSLLLAAETLLQSIESTGTFSETERRIDSLLAGWTGGIGNHRLQLNLRGDRNSQFGNKTTGSGSYGYQFNDQWRARIALATGFKAPTFNDLYFPDSALFGGGNPDLKPESSRNKEIGLNYDAATTSGSLTLYRNDIANLIQWRPDAPGSFSWHPDNVGQARLEGGTLSGQQRIGNVTLRGSLDIQNHKDLTTDKYLILRAKQHATVGFDHHLGRLTWGASVLASGSRFNDTANTQTLGGYATVALHADYRLDHDLTLFAKAGNVFDRDYELRKDYATAGRTFFVGLRYQPK